MNRNRKRKGIHRPVIVTAAAVLALAISAATTAQEKKVYRWVDEDGNVHYSESLPPDYRGETHDEMRGDGIVTDEGVSRVPPPPAEEPEPEVDKGELPRDKSGLKRPEPLYSDSERQEKMDRLLMLRYHSEDELVDAMEIEINQLEYDARLLDSTRNSLESSLKSKIDSAGNRQRAGLPVGEDKLSEIASLRARLKKNQRDLLGLEKRENEIRENFHRDIERYRELVEMYSEAEEES